MSVCVQISLLVVKSNLAVCETTHILVGVLFWDTRPHSLSCYVKFSSIHISSPSFNQKTVILRAKYM